MTSLKNKRRDFLRNAALMTIAAPFVRTLTARSEAQATDPCLILLFHGNGHRRGQWAERRTDSDFDLRRIAMPLAPFRDKTILFTGLNHDAMKRSNWPRTKHGKGSGIAFTGTAVTTSGWPSGPSVDQFIASRVVGTRVPSIQLGAGVGDTNAYGRTIYADGGRPIAPIQVPLEAYRTLFAGALPSESDAARRLLARRRSLLDFSRREVCDLDRSLGAEDRRRLDAHCESIRELERGLADDLSSPIACEAPSELHGERANGGTYQRVLDQHIALLTIALSCGMTRVASLALGQAHGGLVSNEADAATGSHHEASHYRAHAGGDAAYIRISEWYTRRVASLLSRLDAVAGTGGTLLDHTMLIWGTDIADGEDHSEEDVPWAVFGGRALGLRGGRMLDVSRRNVNDLLISACHAMGLRDVTSFGHADLCRGPLPLT